MATAPIDDGWTVDGVMWFRDGSDWDTDGPEYPHPVATRNGTGGRWAVGRGLTRPILAYLLMVTIGVWVYLAIEDVKQGGDLVGASVPAAAALVGSGLGPLVLLLFLLIPAMALTIELVHRFEATTHAARSVLGAASWAGWCLFVAITLAFASRAVAGPETLAGDLFLFVAAGAAFSVLAFDGYQTRAGSALTLLALAVTASVILGSMWMAGRWSSVA